LFMRRGLVGLCYTVVVTGHSFLSADEYGYLNPGDFKRHLLHVEHMSKGVFMQRIVIQFECCDRLISGWDKVRVYKKVLAKRTPSRYALTHHKPIT